MLHTDPLTTDLRPRAARSGARAPRAGLAALAAISLLAACGTPGPKAVTAPSPSPSASPSPSPSASPSPSPSPSPSLAPSAEPTPSPISGGGSVSADGALLVKPGLGQPPKGNAGQCSAWFDAGWTGDCGIVQVVGQSPAGALAWVVEHQPSQAASGQTAWRAFVMTSSGNVWNIALIAGDAGGTWSKVSMHATPLEGNGESQLVFGFRYLGASNKLAYDVVQYDGGGTPQVVAHRSLADGAATLSGGEIEDWAGQYPHGEAACCPAYFVKSILHWSAPSFQVTTESQVATKPSGDF